jgi:hypothetical protein
MALLRRFDIVRRRLPSDLSDAIVAAMAKAGFQPTAEPSLTAEPYRASASSSLSMRFEQKTRARAQLVAHVRVWQKGETTLSVELHLPASRVRPWMVMLLLTPGFITFGANHLGQGFRGAIFVCLYVLGMLLAIRANRPTRASAALYPKVLDALADAIDGRINADAVGVLREGDMDPTKARIAVDGTAPHPPTSQARRGERDDESVASLETFDDDAGRSEPRRARR